MTEKELAYNICQAHARTLMDGCSGATIGGAALAERYTAMWSRDGYCSQETWRNAQALRHWVAACGYDGDGNVVVCMADTIQNC